MANLVMENVPAVPEWLERRSRQYNNCRGAAFKAWGQDARGEFLLITTRFGDTAQVHRVRAPMGYREQITFEREPIDTVRLRPRT